MKIKLEFCSVIEPKIDDKYNYHDIRELIADNLYNILENGEDYLKLCIRGGENYENTGLFA